ncbi:hypothetical protein Ae168Ps1_5684c [Pseudonocardia sp. Ae168_Ps1]|uniref:HNH endonuclease signature motif containing protein n=1 Tax=unclassified Pseudonocardia TaxID=2619320 RepID=UPI00094AF8A6|nr:MULTISPECIES: HNH endonuclease signature motif containing protein [unclassified Pseudonocardia]OLL71181.1 hypothetical protein Ae168Ps1_5684c [Pseudonocardia sp. Ae168_Ps1]OLL77269.1 hypothetical protein Ae150APs1_5647 [Pseudonocardia sp. Ae150A_Ps1]OLL88621.1 hypothetical protein Ae263Ps1_5676c [Pseudonocardia sp. Ae263_Ps1]OLL91358.1 hypothetical protein Ae356Ps1_1255 [Pseudonocardia sp. Ae356_Ps1]
MVDLDGDLVSLDAVLADPCPHGMPRSLCARLCGDDEPWAATVHRDRPVGHGLALECQTAGGMSDLLSDEQVLAVVEGAERMVRWASALRTRMLGEFASRHPAGSRAAPPDADPRAVCEVSRWLPDQVALVLGVSRDQARGLLGEALRFRQVLPRTLSTWEPGEIDERLACAIGDAIAVLSDELAREVEDRILAGAPGTPYRLLRDRLRRAIARADPDGARVRHERAKADRRMSISRGDEGMASLWLGGTAEQTEASWRCVDRLARSLGTDDPRTLDQRRVDLAHQLLQGTLSVTDLGSVCAAVEGELGRAGAEAVSVGEVASIGEAVSVTEAVVRALAAKPDPSDVIGRKPLIQVVVSLDTLLGADRPAELVGHGPIPAVTARALAAGGVWQRLVTDPLSGVCLDHGRSTYHPPEGLADFVRSRDGTCRGPSCTRPIRDLDHLVPWAAGGPTSAANLHGLCLGHHKLKDVAGWQVLAGPDGALTWISPCGWSETTRPKDYRYISDPLDRRADIAGPRTATGPSDDPAELTPSPDPEVVEAGVGNPSEAPPF